MSGDPPQRGSGWQHRRAEGIIRSILNDHRSTADLSPSGELYRVIERVYGSTAASGGLASDDSMPPDPNRDSTRRPPLETRSRPPRTLPTLTNPPAGPPQLPPLRSLYRRNSAMSGSGTGSGSSRPRYRPSDHYMERYRSIFDQRLSDMDDLTNLDDANSHLRALLELSNNNDTVLPPPSPPLMPSPAHTHDHAEDSRRIKRRKLDSDRLIPNFKGFRYGRYGQVEPGQLTMEIVSCDGGMFSEEASYAAENILKDDNMVYCTKGNRCNIILRHQGATAFSLKELIIKGPVSNYSSPVREGMVFISMNKDDLLMRTARHAVESTRPSARSAFDRDARPLAPILSIRHNEDGTILTRAQIRQRRLHAAAGDEEELEHARGQIPSEFAVAPPPPFQVTTECSDEAGEEMAHPPYRRGTRAPNRIGVLPFESDSSDEWAQADESSFDEMARRSYRRLDGSVTFAEPAEVTTPPLHEATTPPLHEAGGRAAGGELMAPHAKFYIERGKNKCTIRFEPPVSGRFVLLKMWNSQAQSDNIDIQAVVARGFAGPRYFPAVELR